ncbi:MAG: hypothetical protein ACRCZO_10435 [Cetobacterium sp.]
MTEVTALSVMAASTGSWTNWKTEKKKGGIM